MQMRRERIWREVLQIRFFFWKVGECIQMMNFSIIGLQKSENRSIIKILEFISGSI